MLIWAVAYKLQVTRTSVSEATVSSWRYVAWDAWNALNHCRIAVRFVSSVCFCPSYKAQSTNFVRLLRCMLDCPLYLGFICYHCNVFFDNCTPDRLSESLYLQRKKHFAGCCSSEDQQKVEQVAQTYTRYNERHIIQAPWNTKGLPRCPGQEEDLHNCHLIVCYLWRSCCYFSHSRC